MADIQEIQEYLWKNLIFHNYSLTKETKTKANCNVRMEQWCRAEVTCMTCVLAVQICLTVLHLYCSLCVCFGLD